MFGQLAHQLPLTYHAQSLLTIAMRLTRSQMPMPVGDNAADTMSQDRPHVPFACLTYSPLKHPLAQELLHLRLQVPLQHDMFSNRIDYTLLLLQPQRDHQRLPQRIELPINPLHACQLHIAATFLQGVDGQLVAWRSRDEVWKVWRALLGR